MTRLSTHVRQGEIYRVRMPLGSARSRRAFLIVSRQEFIEASYSSVVCVPVYSNANGVESEVAIGVAEGLAHPSFLRCDEVTSIAKSRLLDYVGSLGDRAQGRVRRALATALGILPEDIADL